MKLLAAILCVAAGVLVGCAQHQEIKWRTEGVLAPRQAVSLSPPLAVTTCEDRAYPGSAHVLFPKPEAAIGGVEAADVANELWNRLIVVEDAPTAIRWRIEDRATIRALLGQLGLESVLGKGTRAIIVNGTVVSSAMVRDPLLLDAAINTTAADDAEFEALHRGVRDDSARLIDGNKRVSDARYTVVLRTKVIENPSFLIETYPTCEDALKIVAADPSMIVNALPSHLKLADAAVRVAGPTLEIACEGRTAGETVSGWILAKFDARLCVTPLGGHPAAVVTRWPN